MSHTTCTAEAMEPLFDAIRSQQPEFGEALSNSLTDLLHRLLTKDPSARITLQDCLAHEWLEHKTQIASFTEHNHADDCVERATRETSAAMLSSLMSEHGSPTIGSPTIDPG